MKPQKLTSLSHKLYLVNLVMNRGVAFLSVILSLLSCLIFFSTCKKEYSFEGGGTPSSPPATGPGGNAVFSLSGSSGNCKDAIVRGTYLSGVRLSSANTVDINVNVTEIGNFTISTDTLNGIWFSGSGTFTTLGDQKITLKGNGTPEFPRNLVFAPLTTNSGCSFKITVTDREPLAVYVLESGFGNPNPCIHTISGTYKINIPLATSNTVNIRVYVSYPGNFTIATSTVNGMMFFYSGSFTTTGAQDVLLHGTGVPIASGHYSFIPEIVGPHPLGGQTCAFFITVN